MQLSQRDDAVVRLVAEFHQLSASQIRELVFCAGWRTSVARSLDRLMKGDYVRRVGRLATDHAGSAAYVYQLGAEGWGYIGKKGKYNPYTGIDPHMVGVADIVCDFAKAERAGRLEFIVPDGAHLEVPIGYGDAAADIWLKIGFPGRNKRAEYYIEYERTKKAKNYIETKCKNYVAAAYNLYDKNKAAVFPFVVFVVKNEVQRMQAEKVIRSHGEDAELFKVFREHELIDGLLGA